jgi:hypothetical protein
MAITQKIITNILDAGSHVFEATSDVAVTTIHLCENTNTGNRNVDIFLLPFDGSTTVPGVANMLYHGVNIPAEDTFIIDTEKLILGPGDKIYIQAGSGTGTIVATISTIGL